MSKTKADENSLPLSLQVAIMRKNTKITRLYIYFHMRKNTKITQFPRFLEKFRNSWNQAFVFFPPTVNTSRGYKHTHTQLLQDNNTAKAAIITTCTHIEHSQLFNSYITTPRQSAKPHKASPPQSSKTSTAFISYNRLYLLAKCQYCRFGKLMNQY